MAHPNPIIPSAPLPLWIDLPTDLTANILNRLNSIELLQSAQRVCTTWWSVCKDPAMWRVIDMSIPRIRLRDFPDLNPLEEMCRHAVDRSQGQLIDIKIDCFGTNKLLQYIVKRSSQLRRLRISYQDDRPSGKGLIELVQNNPLLEELHVSFFSSDISADDMETIGLSCPMLKSFRFDYRMPVCDSLDKDNECSLAIARTMPNLRHLRLVGNLMKIESLQAILDGCLHLESLDLRGCSNLPLKGELLKLCSERITDLRFPDEFIVDEFEPHYFFDAADYADYYADYDADCYADYYADYS